MNKEQAVEVFELARREGCLPQKIDDLVPLSFIGQAAVSFYREKIKLMDQLKMTEDQRRATLRDGQDAGEMLLDIETRIGELLPPPEEAKRIGARRTSGLTRGEDRPTAHPGINDKRAHTARTIAKHPEIVEKVKAQARENEDIPTRTAVINEIRYAKERQRQKEAEGKREESRAIIDIEQTQYLNALHRLITILPQKPPKKWNDAALKEATAIAKIIIKRLEVFV